MFQESRRENAELGAPCCLQRPKEAGLPDRLELCAGHPEAKAALGRVFPQRTYIPGDSPPKGNPSEALPQKVRMNQKRGFHENQEGAEIPSRVPALMGGKQGEVGGGAGFSGDVRVPHSCPTGSKDLQHDCVHKVTALRVTTLDPERKRSLRWEGIKVTGNVIRSFLLLRPEKHRSVQTKMSPTSPDLPPPPARLPC